MQPKSTEELSKFFSSQSIALIGASPKDDRIYPNLKKFFKGRIYPVNPRYTEVYEMRCYPTLDEIPERVDCAGILVPRDNVEPILKSCAEHGIKYVVIFASGFGEVDEKGKVIENEIKRIAKSYGITVIGPNSSGFINTQGLSPFWFPNAPPPPSTSGVGMISQSGGILSYVYRYGVARKLGFSYVISSGNETVTKLTDYLEFMIADNRTKVIVLALEGIEDGQTLKESFVHALASHKPIILLKLGQSERGNEMVTLHSGRMATSGRILKALCQQFGVIWVEGIDQILDAAEILVKAKGSKGNRVGVALFSGGLSAFLLDWAEKLGLELPKPKTVTREKFASLLNIPKAGLENPFDLQPPLIALNASTLIKILAEDGEYDWIMIRTPLLQTQMPEFLRQVKEASTQIPIPVVCFTPITSERTASDDGVPVISGAENTLQAIRAAMNYFAKPSRERVNKQARRPPEAEQILSTVSTTLLPFESAARIANLYGIPTVESQTVQNIDGAEKAVREIGYPVVLKNDGLFHRTEQNAVKTDIRNDEELKKAFTELVGNGAERILVQKYVRGIEVIVGFKRDPQIGPSVIFGTGGIFAEVIDDLCIKIPPLSIEDAYEMMREVKGFRLLSGYRGKSKGDIDALARVLVNLSRIAVDFKDQISEMDMNPVFVLDEGKGVMAADIKIVLEEKLTRQV